MRIVAAILLSLFITGMIAAIINAKKSNDKEVKEVIDEVVKNQSYSDSIIKAGRAIQDSLNRSLMELNNKEREILKR